VGDEEEAVVVLLEAEPVLERTVVVPEVEPAGRPCPADDRLARGRRHRRSPTDGRIGNGLAWRRAIRVKRPRSAAVGSPCPCASAPSPTSRRTAAVARMTSTSGRTSIELADSTVPGRGAQQRRAKKPRSGAGMMLAMDRAQALRGDVGIDLGSPDVGVSQESLDDAEIGAPTEEVGREGMPERMRGDARVDAGGPRAPAHELP